MNRHMNIKPNHACFIRIVSNFHNRCYTGEDFYFV